MMPDVGQIMAWEDGTMSPEDEVVFFQGMIDSAVVWQLQGCYGRRAVELIKAGLCTRPEWATVPR
jgi:hypothetical protein